MKHILKHNCIRNSLNILYIKNLTSNNLTNFNSLIINRYSKYSFSDVKKKKIEIKTSAYVARPELSPSINNIDCKTQ